jgi:hypothetical protein
MFAACEKNNAVGNSKPENIRITAAEDGFVFANSGVQIVLGAPAAEITAALGEPRSIVREPSCAFDGFDVTYIYNDFYVETFPVKDVDYINIIDFLNDGVKTSEGLYIGMETSDMIRIYGENFKKEQNMHTYEKNGTELAILTEDDIIIQITYYYKMLD